MEITGIKVLYYTDSHAQKHWGLAQIQLSNWPFAYTVTLSSDQLHYACTFTLPSDQLNYACTVTPSQLTNNSIIQHSHLFSTIYIIRYYFFILHQCLFLFLQSKKFVSIVLNTFPKSYLNAKQKHNISELLLHVISRFIQAPRIKQI